MVLEPDNDDGIEETSPPPEETNNGGVVEDTSSLADEPDKGDVVEGKLSSTEEPDKEEILTTTAAPPESRFRRVLRLSIRWGIGLLIVFALGFMTAVLLLYIPVRDGKSQLEAEILQVEARVDTLEGEKAHLENKIKACETREDELEAEIEDLQEELTKTNLHILILSALSDINAARVALVNDDAAEAQVYLTNTMETLETLEELVGPDQRDKVIAMQNRLALVLAEIEAEPLVALSDLEVLANNLTVLENTFFVEP